jgi:hypothetical protein
MNDGDLLECLTTSSAVNTRSTKSQASSTPNPRLLFQNPTDVSTRNHVADGKSLLQKQKAVVWNRPSVARPKMMWWQGTENDERTYNYRRHAMHSPTESRDEKETAFLDATKGEKPKESLRATNARLSLSKRLFETNGGNVIF